LGTLVADLETFSPGHAKIAALKTLAAVSVSKGAPQYFGDGSGPITLEDWKASPNPASVVGLADLLGARIALLHDDDFNVLSKELPIIARNYLENGISRNLWYEEVVPREARFFTMISRHQDKDDLNIFLTTRNHLVQIGANATVGYGLCEFKTI
jgi:CRISPR-associated protein Cmr4